MLSARGSLAAALAGVVVCLLLFRPGHGADKPADPLPITGKADPKFARFDEAVSAFLVKHKLPGAALAVARDGQLIYSRGFGFAERETKQTMQPDALFRISSISKCLTAVAVLRLVEQGKLRLDDRVFDLLRLRAPRDFDERWKKVTVRQLLEHRGGWDSEKSPDPMFLSPVIVRKMGGNHPASTATILRYMLGQDLDFDPGERFGYSNFGYCLLGRVIERVSGQFYEAHLRQHLLAPLGIKRMRLGKTLYPDRAPGEVRYYTAAQSVAVMGPLLGRQVAVPYGGWCLEAMDAHGGWVGSAPDLVRFAADVTDDKESKLLKPASVRTLFERPEGEKGAVYYGKGWVVRPFGEGRFAAWHDGTIEGSSCMLVRRADGVVFAIFFNSREKDSKLEPVGAIELALHQAIDATFAGK